ncbi:MAG TPA: GNAT family protein [Caproicibacter sp.]|nr:GNAT family protein [Caproicibacter sp.]
MEFELRRWKPSDAESFFRYSGNPKIAANMRASFPTTPDEAKMIVDCFVMDDESRIYSRAISVNGEAVGSIAVFLKEDVYSKSGEIAYWLGEPFWGNGIMSSVVSQVCAAVFEKYGIVRIFAEPYAQNTASRKVLEKAGFALEGTMKKGVYKDGSFFDYCMYAMVK